MIQQLKTTKIILTAPQEKIIYKIKRWLKNQSKKLKNCLLKKNNAIMKNKKKQFFLSKIMPVN
jgi:DNA topoisomerase VI subunit B